MAKAVINGQTIFGNVAMGSGGGGVSFDTLASGEKISTTTPSGAYQTVTVSDLTSYDLVLIKLYDTVDSTEYTDYIAVNPAIVSTYRDFTARLHPAGGNINVRVTPTTITCTSYSGLWQDVYIDVIGTNDDLFE